MRKAFITISKIVFYWGFIQIILIGAKYFGVFPTAEVHAMSGHVMEGLFVILLVLAVIGKMGAPIIGFSLLGLLMLSPATDLLIRAGSPYLAALHPVFGIGAMFMGQTLAKRAEKLG